MNSHPPRTLSPGEVTEIETAWIPLSDGCRLAARIWLPAGAEERARGRGHGVHPVPAPRSESHARRTDAPVLCRARLRQPARGSARFRRLVGDPRGRVHPTGVGRRNRGDRVDRGPALVQRVGRHDRAFLGRIHGAPDRGAPPSGPESDHHRRLHRRSLSRRHALHRRLPHRRSDGVGHRVPLLPEPAPGPGSRRRRVAA